MFDLPPNTPPEPVPSVIAQAPQAQPKVLPASANDNRVIGVCHLVQNPPTPPLTAVNALSPVVSVWGYLKDQERLEPNQLKDEMFNAAKVILVQDAEHGTLKKEWGNNYRYHPTPGYYGSDHATYVVEIGDIKVKTLYFFKVGASAWGGTEGYDPYWDEKNCPDGPLWKISRNIR